MKIREIFRCVGVSLIVWSIGHQAPRAAPGNLAQIPLFVAPTPPPNIFFALDDSGSMNWAMPVDGVSSDAWFQYWLYDTIPDDRKEWRAWCRGANLLAYDPGVEYKPWHGKDPLNGNPFPDMTDITQVWINPAVAAGIDGNPSNDYIWWADPASGNYVVGGSNYGIIDLSNAPVVIGWHDADGDGVFDPEECPVPNGDFSWGRSSPGGPPMGFYSDSPYIVRAADLPPDERTNFANWFAYYRTRMHATKAAVTRVVAGSSARMGMATLHHNEGVGKAIQPMNVSANRDALLEDLIGMRPSGGTPLRRFLNDVGKYFDQTQPTPSSLNIGAAPSPILPQSDGGECQQNFVMLMTDGQWNGGNPGVGHQDKDPDPPYVFEAHRDANPNTLADVAMKWYRRDLAPSLAGKVPTQTGAPQQNLDENNEQHLVTFGVAFGPVGTLSSDPADRHAPFTWPKPFANADTTVDDLRHAAYNGRGLFLSARDPQALISALETVIADIEARQGSAASVAFNTTSLQTNTMLFFASFDTTGWGGDLYAWHLDPVNGDLTTVAWQAADKLDARSDTDVRLHRTIYTLGNTASGKDGVLFDWWDGAAPDPVTDIQNDLSKNPDGSSDTPPFGDTRDRLDFLRGDTALEATKFRKRKSRLGDIIHSAPRYVGIPDSGWPDTPPFGDAAHPYSAFQTSLAASPREEMVYVGANDGMLHGFRVSDGEEILAYVPAAVASSALHDGLHYLTELGYNHRYYVDGTPTVADVFIKTVPSGSKSWRTVLVGSLRGGGRGVFALDVTDPSQFTKTETNAAKVVLWEFTDQDDSDLGYTFSTPQIAMMNNGKWAVVLGNGYNATGSPTAQLLILYLEGGIDGHWDPSDYVKIDTGVGTPSNPNGLSTPALVDLDGDGTVDRIYAGDLHGNLWAFEVASSSDSGWKIAHTVSGTPQPLYSAGASHPITMQPLVLKPDWVTDTTNNEPNVMVYFGTGQYIAIGDATDTNPQAFYGIWDTGMPVPASKLVEQTLQSSPDPDIRILSQNAVTYQDPPSAGDLGWYIPLPEAGERVVVNALAVEGVIFFNTVIPSSAPCSAGGDSWLMSVDAKTGGNPTKPAFDYDGNGTVDDADKPGADFPAGERFGHGVASASSVLAGTDGGNYQYTSGTDSEKPQKRRILGSARGRRLSWKEIIE